MNQAKAVAMIENPREYKISVVEQLRHLLEAGAAVQPDPRRPQFYEIEGEDETFYIHISPFTSNVVLLAKWSRQTQRYCPDSSCAVA